MTPDRRDVIVWVGGAIAIVAAVLLWLWWTRPEENLLPSQYNYGVL